jgi:hypothetical protein
VGAARADADAVRRGGFEERAARLLLDKAEELAAKICAIEAAAKKSAPRL